LQRLESERGACEAGAMIASLSYRGGALDRANPLRHAADPAELARHPGARFLVYWRGLHPVDPTRPVALRLGPDHVLPLIAALDPPCLLLGIEDEAPLIALDLSAAEGKGESGPILDPSDGWIWQGLRAIGARLPAEETALLAYARGMLLWRSRTRFCSVCGAPLRFEEAGHVGTCTNSACAAPHYPRTDPAVIVLVVDPAGRVLLGRQPQWTPGLYSCLAGFVEPGEALEEAAAREVFEEAGIRIDDVHYVASQPWPFPSSLMVGFTATASGADPVPDQREIEDVRWFTRAELDRFGTSGAPGPDGYLLPGPDSIARLLIERWRRG